MGEYVRTRTGMGYQFDEDTKLLLIEPDGNFKDIDFEVLGSFINQHYQLSGELPGVILNSKKFPYWKGVLNFRQYLSFAANNHYKFKKVAMTMNGFLVKVVLSMARGRAHPEIKIFPYNKISAACDWLTS